MSSKILFIGEELDEWLINSLEPGTSVATTGFGSGLPHLEYAVYEHFGVDTVIQKSLTAEKEGFNAVVIGCFYDPGLFEARELLTIPVVGVCEATLHAASMLCAGKYSVLVGRRKWIPRMSDNVRNYGFETKIASWRVLDLTVPDMTNHESTQEAILRESKSAVEHDLAEAICLGCTSMSVQARHAQEEIGVPVLDPIVIGLKMAEFRINLHKRFNITHSKIGGYETPPKDELANVLKNTYGPKKAVQNISHLIRNK